MANIREYNMNGTLILGIDHGYGNIKTAHRVFPTALIKSEKAPTFSKDYLEYDGYFRESCPSASGEIVLRHQKYFMPNIQLLFKKR